MTLSRDKVTGLLRISGTLDIDAANSLREALLDLTEVDLSEVDGCDAAALQVLLAAGKGCRMLAPSNAVTQTAAALGLSFDEKDHRIAT